MQGDTLYYGDNLEVLRRHIPDEYVDLVYLDPPFKSNQNYNVLFAEGDGSRSSAQIRAFEDTWHWDRAAAINYEMVVESGTAVSQAMQSFRGLLGENDMLAYLAMMAPRLVELHRVLKPTGSLYLHCDPTASHYLKILLDAAFGPSQFRNEIIWKRSHPHGNVTRTFGSIHDTILFYSKSDQYAWSKPHKPYFLPNGSIDPELEEELLSQYSLAEPDSGRRFQATSLLNPNPDRPNLTYEFHGHKKVWRWTRERMLKAEAEGRLYFPRNGKGVPREKRYLDEQEGFPLQDIWTDVRPISPRAAERLGYPTQKPETLLERILEASSAPGDCVLDPFCGCGTTVSVAQRLGRRWLGIDVTHLAIGLIKHRLHDSHGLVAEKDYRVVGEPEDLAGAQQLALEDTHQFEHWALGKVHARSSAKHKGPDRGIDGKLLFHDEALGGATKTIIISVKSGKSVGVSAIRDLGHVVDREGAAMGVLITLRSPTKAMLTEAAGKGFYSSPWGTKHPRLQVLTVEDLLAGKQIDSPPRAQVNETFKRAQRPQVADKSTPEFLF